MTEEREFLHALQEALKKTDTVVDKERGIISEGILHAEAMVKTRLEELEDEMTAIDAEVERRKMEEIKEGIKNLTQ